VKYKVVDLRGAKDVTTEESENSQREAGAKL
jgi:hypothetical protein